MFPAVLCTQRQLRSKGTYLIYVFLVFMVNDLRVVAMFRFRKSFVAGGRKRNWR